MKPMAERSAKDRICLVAGATRGAGRAIALELGRVGATVYCTGRSLRGQPSDLGRSETLEETAEGVCALGGQGIALQVDHTQESQVRDLMAQIEREHGRLDVLVNSVWGGEKWVEWGKPFWELDFSQGSRLLERAVLSHLLNNRYAVPLMVKAEHALLIEMTDGCDWSYRGNQFYDLAKVGTMRLAWGMAQELKDTSVTAVSLTPGFLRSEEMLDHFGVSESNWRDAVAQDPYFAESETPHFVGRAVAALVLDPHVAQKRGCALSSWDLSREYGFTDIDGRSPHWGDFFRDMQASEKTAVSG